MLLLNKEERKQENKKEKLTESLHSTEEMSVSSNYKSHKKRPPMLCKTEITAKRL